MNKKLFLFVVTLLIILSNVSCVKAPFSVKKADFDGLIIDVTKQDRPAMTYKIFTQKGEVPLYGPLKLKPEIGREHGIGQFANTIDEAKAKLELRGVKNPLIIKTVGTASGFPKGLLVSDEDAEKILAADKNIDFLANAKVAFVLKRKIYVEGVGASLEASQDAPLEIRKQEAFIAAFLDGIRNIAEKIADLEKLPITKWKGKKGEALFSNLHKKVAGFEVDSQTIVKEKDFELTDIIIINFKGQRFIIKNFQLIFPPVEFVEFPKWDNPPAAISGVQIQDLEWEEDEGEALCTIKLLYHYDVTKSEIIKSDTKAIYRPENIEPSSFMYTGLVVDARGLGLRPSMNPRILVRLNSTTKVLYGPEVVFKEEEAGISYGAIPKESAVTLGLSGYQKTLSNTLSSKKRLGENPLTVRAIEVKSKSKGDVVISREDADRILEAVKNNDFFKECRVVMVLD